MDDGYGYNSWRNNFKRNVKKGEHGIKIFAPMPFIVKEELEILDPVTKQPIIGEDGQPLKEEYIKMQAARFKPVSVFDISQTEGEPLPELIENISGNVARYELFTDALRTVSPLPVVFEALPEDTDGLCHFGKNIAIREGMSEAQTISAIIHEIAHAKLHDRTIVGAKGEKPKDRRTDEVVAESISYAVCQYYGIETANNSFGYIVDWSKALELKELNSSLDTIRKAAAEIIDGIDEKYCALAKERGIDLSADIAREQMTIIVAQEIPAKIPEATASEVPVTETVINNIPDYSAIPFERRKIGTNVLMTPLFYDMNFNRSGKKIRVTVEEPAGKYQLFSREEFKSKQLYFLTASGMIDRISSHFPDFWNEETKKYESRRPTEAEFDEYIPLVAEQYNKDLADPEKWALHKYAAVLDRIAECEAHNVPVREQREEERRRRREAAELERQEEKRLFEEKYDARVDEIASAIHSGKTIRVGYSENEFYGKNPVLDLFKLYGVELPLRTQGWVNTGLAEITDGSYRYYKSKHKGDSSAFGTYLKKLREAIRQTPIEQLRQKEQKTTPDISSDKEETNDMEYTEFQERGFAVAETYSALPLQERLDIIAQTFGCKTARVETSSCIGKWSGTSDISIVLDNRAALFVGNCETTEARKESLISEYVNCALGVYNPQTAAETKRNAVIALMDREASDNAIAAERGYKPYKVLTVELAGGADGKTGLYPGWYYATVMVDGKFFGIIESGLNCDIKRGKIETREKFSVAGGLKENEVDFVWGNTGHSTKNQLYKMDLSAEVLKRAQEKLTVRERLNKAVERIKAAETHTKAQSKRLFDAFAEQFPDFAERKYSYMRLEAQGFEPLSLEWIGTDTISVMHTYTMNGDLMYDPMITFAVDLEAHTMSAAEFEQSMPPLYQCVNKDGSGESIDGNGNQQEIRGLEKQINDFAFNWFRNIEQQGYMPVKAHLIVNKDEEVTVAFDKDGKPIEPEKAIETEKPIEPQKPFKSEKADEILPDPAWTVPEMNEYGYTKPDMYPLSAGKALELFDTGHAIYMLYDDNTEAIALDRDDIATFKYGYFCGITKADWEASPLYTAQRAAEKSAEGSLEADLLYGGENKFGIYQVRDDIQNVRDIRFAPIVDLKMRGFTVDRKNYELVYTGNLDIHDTQTNLHKLYELFQADNPECPSDYRARSVSVSDVIVLNWRGHISSNYVDRAGFTDLGGFLGEETPYSKETFSQVGKSEHSKSDKPAQQLASKGKPSLLARVNEAKREIENNRKRLGLGAKKEERGYK